jgi:hypothetical protein
MVGRGAEWEWRGLRKRVGNGEGWEREWDCGRKIEIGKR